MNRLGIRIKTLRLAKGYSQAELAAKIGGSSTGICLWENGMLCYSRSIPKLARALDVDPVELAELWMADSLERMKREVI